MHAVLPEQAGVPKVLQNTQATSSNTVRLGSPKSCNTRRPARIHLHIGARDARDGAGGDRRELRPNVLHELRGEGRGRGAVMRSSLVQSTVPEDGEGLSIYRPAHIKKKKAYP